MSIDPVDIETNGPASPEPAWVRSLREAVRGLRFGSVEVVVHDGRVVQIERREKVRFDDAGRRRPDRGLETPEKSR
jgi:hypothetical protein